MHKYSILKNEWLPFEYFPTNNHLLEEVNSLLVDKKIWFSKGYYMVEKDGNELRFYNLQVDMRGILQDSNTKAPTAGYFVIVPHVDGGFEFSAGTHRVK